MNSLTLLCNACGVSLCATLSIAMTSPTHLQVLLSLFSTIASIGFTGQLIYGHLNNFSKPKQQKQIVRVRLLFTRRLNSDTAAYSQLSPCHHVQVLVLVPFFGLMSFFSLLALYAHSAQLEAPVLASSIQSL